jgi:hypothetical protein
MPAKLQKAATWCSSHTLLHMQRCKTAAQVLLLLSAVPQHFGFSAHLQRIRSDLIGQPDAAPLLLQVNDHATPRLLDELQR